MAETVDTETDVIADVPRQLFIAGQWVPAADGRTFGVENPATETQLCEIADGGAADSARAVEAAVAAQESWARTAPRVRSAPPAPPRRTRATSTRRLSWLGSARTATC
jgi:succinate-semialdehyde dehydrogenase/glutarate-semialdehyde dehydrogenase